MKAEMVYWLDAATQDGWTEVSDTGKHTQLTLTVGFLIKEDKHVLTLAHTYDPESDCCNGLMFIPKGMIKKRKTIWKSTDHKKAQ